MGKKACILAAIGFPLGILVAVMLGFFGRAPGEAIRFCSLELAARVGGETAGTLLHFLGSGLYGALCMAGSCLYDVERWPLALATLAHYLIIAVGSALCNWLLAWGMGLKLFLSVLAIQSAGFFLIWLLIWLRYRREVRELNELNRNKER